MQAVQALGVLTDMQFEPPSIHCEFAKKEPGLQVVQVPGEVAIEQFLGPGEQT